MVMNYETKVHVALRGAYGCDFADGLHENYQRKYIAPVAFERAQQIRCDGLQLSIGSYEVLTMFNELLSTWPVGSHIRPLSYVLVPLGGRTKHRD
jgi:hypothetical protein